MAFRSDTFDGRESGGRIKMIMIQTHVGGPTLSLLWTLPFLSSPVITPALLAHSTTSSANIVRQCVSFLGFSISESIMVVNRKCKGWNLILYGVHLPLQTPGSLVHATHLTTVSHWRYMSFTSRPVHQSDVLLWHVGCFFQINEHIV